MQQGLTVDGAPGRGRDLEYQRDRGMGITVYFGKRKGSASTADLRARGRARHGRQGLRDRALHGRGCLRRARRSGGARARHARSGPGSSLGPRARGRRSSSRALRGGRARASMRASPTPRARRSRPTARSRVYGNSLGFLARLPGTSHSLSCVADRAARRGHAARLLVLAARAIRPTWRTPRRSAAARASARVARLGARS